MVESELDDETSGMMQYDMCVLIPLIQKMETRILREHARFLHLTFENSVLDRFCSEDIAFVMLIKRYLMCGSYNLIMLNVASKLKVSQQAPLVALHARIITINTRLQIGLDTAEASTNDLRKPIDLVTIDLDNVEEETTEAQGASGKGVEEGGSGKSVEEGMSGRGIEEGASGKGVKNAGSSKEAEGDVKTHQNVLLIESVLKTGHREQHDYVIDMNDVRLSSGLLAEIGQCRDKILFYFFDCFSWNCLQVDEDTVMELNISAIKNDLRYVSRGPFNGPVFADIVKVLTTPDDNTVANANCHVARLYTELVDKIAAALA